jgi:hypothetical protein
MGQSFRPRSGSVEHDDGRAGGERPVREALDGRGGQRPDVDERGLAVHASREMDHSADEQQVYRKPEVAPVPGEPPAEHEVGAHGDVAGRGPEQRVDELEVVTRMRAHVADLQPEQTEEE